MLMSSAYAGDDRRGYGHDDAAARAIIGLGFVIIGGAIIASSVDRPKPQNHYYLELEPQPQKRRSNQYHYQPQYGYDTRRPATVQQDSRPPTHGTWVEKWGYEQSGRACPGPIAYSGGTYWCRVR
ncbi:MAG: hypothetical protein WDZ56_00770 [Candidatus Paceibacterota bacterium]